MREGGSGRSPSRQWASLSVGVLLGAFHSVLTTQPLGTGRLLHLILSQGHDDVLDLGGPWVSSVACEYHGIFRLYEQFKEFSGITLPTHVLPL